MLRTIIIALLLIPLNACNINNTLEKIHEFTPASPTDQSTPVIKDHLNVALLLPITGEYGDIGSNMLQAAQLAFKELNAHQVQLDTIDTGSDLEHSQDMIRKLESKKYDLILGPLLSFHTKIVYGYAFQHHIPVISFSNDISLLNSEGLFLIGMIPNQAINRVVDYAYTQGYNKIFALLPHNRYGLFIENTLRGRPRDQVEIVEIAKYSSNTDGELHDIDHALTIIKAAIIKQATLSGFQEKFALLIPEGGDNADVLVRDLYHWAKTHKVKLKLLGSNQWHDEELINKQYFAGAWIAIAPNSHLQNFEQRFYNLYGEKPFNISAITYDAAALATIISKKGVIYDSLLDQKGFVGASGLFRFHKDGSSERLLSVFEIENRQLLEIDEANNKFPSSSR